MGTDQSFLERHGDVILLGTGLILVAAGVAISSAESRIGLTAVGAALIVLAVVLPRTVGQLKLGPSGLEAELKAIRRDAIDESQRLGRSLAASGLDLPSVAAEGRSLHEVSEATEIRNLLASVLERVARLDEANERRATSLPPSVLLEVAHGLLAAQEWSEAASYFDRYVELNPNDWDALFPRAVAHANARGGRESDLQALRAYNDALAARPDELDPDLMARLFAYRGAMLKRLGRLDEAESDLKLARALARAEYELQDIAYNLACVYAMQGRREDVLRELRSLEGTEYVLAVRAHLDDYFESLRNDREFLILLDL